MKRQFLRTTTSASVAICILLFFVPPSSAQQTNLRFTNYTIDNGLSEGMVSGITQGKQGFMWFGTQDGLDRFDGYEFVIFRHNPFDSTTLSDNTITALFTDSRGELWIGTLNGGLNLFDPDHHSFLHFLVNGSIHNKIIGNYIRGVTEDRKGDLWIGTYGNGLFEFIFSKRKKGHLFIPDKSIHYVHQPDKKDGLANDYINAIYADRENHLWVSGADGLQEADLTKNNLPFSTPLFTVVEPQRTFTENRIQFDLKQAVLKKLAPHNYIVYAFFEDEHHDIWFGGNGGLYLLKHGTDTMIEFLPNIGSKVNLGAIFSICNAEIKGSKAGNSLWVGTWDGAEIFDTKTLTFQLIQNQLNNDKSLLAGAIQSIYKDRSGSIWLGSNGYGVSKYDLHSSLFSAPLYAMPDKNNSTAGISILSFLDLKNYLLLGSYDSTLIINKNNRSMKIAEGPYLIDNMLPADSGKVWMAGVNGLTLYDLYTGKSIIYLPHILIKGDKFEDNRTIKIYKGRKGGIWALTTHSFSYFDARKKIFINYFYNHNRLNSLYYPFHGDIYQDEKGNFWLGSEDGLLYFDTAKKTFQYYVNHPSDTSSISYNVVESVVPDPRQPQKYLWIGTAGGGLNKFNLKTKKFIHFNIKDGLPNNVINGILADDKGNLWISTNKGISGFNPLYNTFHNYDIREGLTSNEFNPGAYYKNDNGEFFFGNIKGFNTFYPDSIFNSSYIPPVVFTDFRLFNKPVIIGVKNSPLKKSISETNSLTLPYKDNLITFQVAALDYTDPDENQYAYRLIGFNKNWINVGNDRIITFSNLDPGHYTLQVKASNSDGVWNEKGVSLTIHILPPWWRTWWAYILYVVIVLFIIWLLRRAEIGRLKLKNRLALEQNKLALEQSRLVLEHQEAEKLKEIDHLKSRFFANISHEFRTPLTLIIGPLKDMIQGGSAEKFSSIVPAMYRNSQRLLQLINQLLDLSKLDSGSYHINTTRTDIVSFVRQITSIFLNLAKRKQIQMEVKTEESVVKELHGGENYFYFDEDVVEKVLTNLISNAFKFTPEGGNIVVSLELAEKEKKYVALKVKDNGAGIPADKLPFVFDRFYQADDSSKRRYEGSGIGLALVKELMILHGGSVLAESSPETGSVFTCLFPFNKKTISVEKETSVDKSDKVIMAGEDMPVINGMEMAEDGKPNVLVVEDNPDVRHYICDKLRDDYSLTECQNGKEGLEAALKDIPDVVVSDVMMPEMDGFELCKKLKTDDRTSHIPVILLTARAEDADKIQGLETGADAYLIKPFNALELQIRINKLIEIRNKMRAKFGGKLVVRPNEVAVSSIDREFILKLKNATEPHIDNPDFKVEILSREMNMSVSQLNRKLKAIINQSTAQYITALRMHRALELLRKNGGSVGEVAWKTGFEDPGYFSKVFKNYFGCLPSERDKFPADA
ncbi:MAG: hybrid sensor histidine kinase/response regulator [Chitinophagaceae bacterium]|nr:MAG: hybrid sensor histidine kinase/response regulator [Chitinophagaceae bacterium]